MEGGWVAMLPLLVHSEMGQAQAGSLGSNSGVPHGQRGPKDMDKHLLPARMHADKKLELQAEPAFITRTSTWHLRVSSKVSATPQSTCSVTLKFNLTVAHCLESMLPKKFWLEE